MNYKTEFIVDPRKYSLILNLERKFQGTLRCGMTERIVLVSLADHS